MSSDSQLVYNANEDGSPRGPRAAGYPGGKDMDRPYAAAPDPLWTAADVARFLNASQSYVYKAAEAGRLPCIRIGSMLRFDPARIRELVRGGGPAPR